MDHYVLDWHVTIAIFVIVCIVMWFFGSVIKLIKPIAILVAIGLTLLAKHYWWWIDGSIKSIMQGLGL